MAAHISQNHLAAAALPALIQGVYRSSSTLGAVATPPAEAVPVVPVKKSVFPDYIVCLEDGKRLKLLKRHLNTRYDMTPAQYRAKWGLPATYPMVAPNYARHRSTMAKNIGLGRKPAAQQHAEAAQVVTKLRARRAKGSRG